MYFVQEINGLTFTAQKKKNADKRLSQVGMCRLTEIGIGKYFYFWNLYIPSLKFFYWQCVFCC